MGLNATLRQLNQNLPLLRPHLISEESTKHSLVMPFLSGLGYAVFNPLEVRPEFISDIGIKKGERVDYALFIENKLEILIECKKIGCPLLDEDMSQLARYFQVTDANIGILTDGVIYKFFTDTESENIMDRFPFFEFNVSDFKDADIEQLKAFSKYLYNRDVVREVAETLKFSHSIKRVLNSWFTTPPEDLVRLIVAELMPERRFTVNMKERLTPLVQKAITSFINEKIDDRLKRALLDESIESAPSSIVETNIPLVEAPSEIELKAFELVKKLLTDHVDIKRLFVRAQQSYCAILLDDNRRRTICRLRFNQEDRLGITLFNKAKEEIRLPLEKLEDLINHKEALLATLLNYMELSVEVK